MQVDRAPLEPITTPCPRKEPDLLPPMRRAVVDPVSGAGTMHDTVEPWSDIRVRIKTIENRNDFFCPFAMDKVDGPLAVQLRMPCIEPGANFFVVVILAEVASPHRTDPTS